MYLKIDGQEINIELVNIIGKPTKIMLTRSMAAKLTVASANECLFADFLSEIEPKKVLEALKHPGWVDPIFHIDVKSSFLNEKLKEEVYVKQPHDLESIEFPDYFEKLMTKKFEMSMMGELTYFHRFHIKQNEKGISICQEKYTRDLLKKYEIYDSASVKTPMVPPNNLDYAECNMDRKSTSGACQFLGGKLVCWSVKKQQSVAMSSVEANTRWYPSFVTTLVPLLYSSIKEPNILISDITSSKTTFSKEILNYTSSSLNIS
nr:hypothetical protein [Tanacetum cinerariifolium]